MPIYCDWTNEKKYEELTKNLDLLGWAWEFLRRNEEYQKDWFIELKARFKTELKGIIKEHDSGAWNPIFEDSIDEIEIARKEGKRWQWINDPYFSFTPPGRFKIDYFEKYGITDFVNPKQDNPIPSIFQHSELFFKSNLTLACSTFHTDERKLKEFYGDRYVKMEIVFDLDQAIGPQLKMLHNYLFLKKNNLGKRRSETSLHEGKWLKYLRIIDAKHQGATSPEIARKLYENDVETVGISIVSNRVDKKYKSAQEIVKFRYRQIAREGLASPRRKLVKK